MFSSPDRGGILVVAGFMPPQDKAESGRQRLEKSKHIAPKKQKRTKKSGVKNYSAF